MIQSTDKASELLSISFGMADVNQSTAFSFPSKVEVNQRDATLKRTFSNFKADLLLQNLRHFIVQEALNNALKHAAATVINLKQTQREEMLVLAISDNGKGFRLIKGNDSGGLGLASMRERVDSLGGDLSIDTEDGEGCKIRVEIDLDQVNDYSDSIDLLGSL